MYKAQEKSKYWKDVFAAVRKNRLAKWGLRYLYLVVFVAVFGDFLANEKPLMCKLEGQYYFPVIQSYGVTLGVAKWEARFVQNDWYGHDYDFVLFPIIPYSSNTLDSRNTGYVGPFQGQNISSRRFRHWLGTDKFGRDTAAGMIAGARISILIGILSMTIAAIIGIFFGALAGYFGDDRLRISRSRFLLNVVGILLAIFFAFMSRRYALSEGDGFGRELLKSILLFAAVIFIFNLLVIPVKKIRFFNQKIRMPVDNLVMRLIEVFNSIPVFLLILAILALIKSPSLVYIMIIIGLVRWTGLARFTRAEFLRIRDMEYIQAARVMGFSSGRIIFRHALPNALTPIFITLAFGIASAILIEASLSFLGIGVSVETVTWGNMLQMSRNYIGAWWLALFPGLAIFCTVTAFNLIGESLGNLKDS